VEQLEGSATAKERLRVVLETLAGTCRVTEACQRLGISEPRFHQVRQEALQAALAGLEPGQAGRPVRKTSATQEQVAVLQEQLAQKDFEVRAAQARAEIALALPQVVQQPAAAESGTTESAAAEKKTPRGRPRKWRRPPGRRKST
jgi:hypothetical protein